MVRSILQVGLKVQPLCESGPAAVGRPEQARFALSGALRMQGQQAILVFILPNRSGYYT